MKTKKRTKEEIETRRQEILKHSMFLTPAELKSMKEDLKMFAKEVKKKGIKVY